MQEKPKRPSGAQLRNRRVERGLPKYTEAELASRKRSDQSPAGKRRRNRAALKSALARAKDNAAFIAALKVRLGCADCGFNAHPAALDFDHLPGFTKTDNIARMLSRTRGRLLEEIAKCECVCSNCHRIRTAERRKLARVPAQPADIAEQLTLS